MQKPNRTGLLLAEGVRLRSLTQTKLSPENPGRFKSTKRGSITKAGNSHARRMLVEAAWSYRFSARVSRRLRDRQGSLPQSVWEIAWKAQVRLCARYQRLIAKGKQSQVAVTAVARELAAFISPLKNFPTKA